MQLYFIIFFLLTRVEAIALDTLCGESLKIYTPKRCENRREKIVLFCFLILSNRFPQFSSELSLTPILIVDTNEGRANPGIRQHNFGYIIWRQRNGHQSRIGKFLDNRLIINEV